MMMMINSNTNIFGFLETNYCEEGPVLPNCSVDVHSHTRFVT